MDQLGSRGGAGLGVALISIGGLYLAAQWTGLDLGRFGWPLFVLLPGLALIAAATQGGRVSASLAVPGSLLATTGLILLVQNTFNLWDTWAYAWTLFIVGAGVGQVVQGARTDQPGLRASGWRAIEGGAVAFVLFGAFFELALNLSHFTDGTIGRFGLPVLLIGLGAAFLVRPWRQATPEPSSRGTTDAA
jgi:hypothetical protein